MAGFRFRANIPPMREPVADNESELGRPIRARLSYTAANNFKYTKQTKVLRLKKK